MTIMQRIKAELIIFDLDGTLIDSRKDIANSVNYTLKAIGLDPLEDRIITGYVGNGVRGLMEKILFPANSYLFDKGMSIFWITMLSIFWTTQSFFPVLLRR